jgi:glycosyltransferase involved in cell wall biosynthesis
VVPFGIADGPLPAGAPALRGVVRGIGVDDEILLWGGGIYNWFDPQTLIRAVDKLRVSRPKLRLVFMGVQHPNPVVKTMRAAVEAWELSNELELTDVHVFFSDSFSSGWIPYAERGRYLADATIGVSTHHDHVETAFSFRTRILDYFWAGLPVVTTRGDALAEVIERAGAGRTVDAGDVDGLASAIAELLDDEAARKSAAAASARLADDYRWSTVAQPLLEFCRDPYRAPDLVDPATRTEILARARLATTRSLATRVASRLRK